VKVIQFYAFEGLEDIYLQESLCSGHSLLSPIPRASLAQGKEGHVQTNHFQIEELSDS
jgi:hypothetical protein